MQKTTWKLNQDSWFPGEDVNPNLPSTNRTATMFAHTCECMSIGTSCTLILGTLRISVVTKVRRLVWSIPNVSGDVTKGVGDWFLNACRLLFLLTKVNFIKRAAFSSANLKARHWKYQTSWMEAFRLWWTGWFHDVCRMVRGYFNKFPVSHLYIGYYCWEICLISCKWNTRFSLPNNVFRCRLCTTCITWLRSSPPRIMFWCDGVSCW
jgi:hypothetical protein